MGKRNICYKTKSRRLVTKRNRPDNLKRKRDHSSSSSTGEESMMSMQSQSTSSKKTVEDNLNFNLIIHLNSLTSLLKQFLCPGCKKFWDGSVTIKERNGLYMQLEFMCYSCESLARLYSSPKMPTGRRPEINIRLGIGGTLCGLGRAGMMKLMGALNLPPPIQEHKYHETQQFILNYVEKAQEQSMIAATEEAVIQAGSVRDLVVSGDGAWLTRGYSSLHGIAALCSTTTNPKVIDATWCSKTCIKCQGAESLRLANPDLFRAFQENHECQLNFTGTPYQLCITLSYKSF
jgi:hypothetical protein